MNSCKIAVVSLIILAMTTLASANSPIEFSGNEVFSDEQLDDALLNHFDFVSAKHKMNDQNAFIQTTKRLLADGYRRSGFPDASFDIRPSDQPGEWNCQIVEGPRFRCGSIEIRGHHLIDPETLIERLTKRFPPSDAFPSYSLDGKDSATDWTNKRGERVRRLPPDWGVGDFHSFESQLVSDRVRTAIADLGFSQATVEVSFPRNLNDQSIALGINVLSEGPSDRVTEIEIVGNKNHSRQTLLDYLDLAEGDLINRWRERRLVKLLWESGRFSKHSVVFNAKSQKLVIDVEEALGIPPVNQPLNDTALHLIRAARWLSQAPLRGDDVEWQGEPQGNSLIFVASEKGLLVDYERSENKHSIGPPFRMSMLINADSLLIDHSLHRENLRVPVLGYPGQIRFGVEIKGASDKKRAGNLRLDLGFRSQRAQDELPIDFALLLTPVDWTKIAYHPTTRSELLDSVFQVQFGKNRISIDPSSGEIKELFLAGGRMRFGVGLFEQRSDARVALGGRPNGMNLQRPLTSVVSYFLQEDVFDSVENFVTQMGVKRENAVLVSGVRKLVQGDWLKVADLMLKEFLDDDDAGNESFEIKSIGTDRGSLTTAVKRMASSWALRVMPNAWDEQNWAVSFLGDYLLRLLGDEAPLKDFVVRSANDPDCGLVRAALITWVVGHKNGALERALANRTLQKLNREAFARDFRVLRPFLSGEFVLPPLLAFQSLTEEEQNAVLERFFSHRPFASRFFRSVHAIPYPDDRDTEAFWFNVLEPSIRDAMKEILEEND